jgi:RNA polymerase sigma-70 factor (ECF subfamily)
MAASVRHDGCDLAGGDAAAFERAYDAHAGAVFRAAYGVVHDPAVAQDVVQDVFLRLWRAPDRYDSTRGPLGHYLRTIARNRALDIWREAQVATRARARLRLLAGREEGRVDDRPAPAAERRRDRAIVRQALLKLPPPQRHAIVLAFWGGMTADEIAVRSGLPQGTVKSRIRLGLIKLREECGDALERPRLAA